VAAIMGGYSALAPGTKASIILGVVLALLLLPVTVVQILLLIAAAVVATVRTRSAGS
jgi:chromate transport protein ChrA